MTNPTHFFSSGALLAQLWAQEHPDKASPSQRVNTLAWKLLTIHTGKGSLRFSDAGGISQQAA